MSPALSPRPTRQFDVLPLFSPPLSTLVDTSSEFSIYLAKSVKDNEKSPS